MVPYCFRSLWRRLRPNPESSVSPALVEAMSPKIRRFMLFDVRDPKVDRLRRHLENPVGESESGLKRPWTVKRDAQSRFLTGHLEIDRDYQSVLVEREGKVLLLTGTSRPLDPPETHLVQLELLTVDRANTLKRSFTRLKTRVRPKLFSPVVALSRISCEEP